MTASVLDPISLHVLLPLVRPPHPRLRPPPLRFDGGGATDRDEGRTCKEYATSPRHSKGLVVPRGHIQGQSAGAQLVPVPLVRGIPERSNAHRNGPTCVAVLGKRPAPRRRTPRCRPGASIHWLMLGPPVHPAVRSCASAVRAVMAPPHVSAGSGAPPRWRGDCPARNGSTSRSTPTRPVRCGRSCTPPHHRCPAPPARRPRPR